MSYSESEKRALRRQLERREEYAQKLSSIQTKIRQVEAKLVSELNGIRTQLQEIGRACSEAETFFDNISEKSEEPADSTESADSGPSQESSELASESGGFYFIIDDQEEYGRLVGKLIWMEMEDIFAASAAEAARSAEEASGETR